MAGNDRVTPCGITNANWPTNPVKRCPPSKSPNETPSTVLREVENTSAASVRVK
jgi:hypothetical protein